MKNKIYNIRKIDKKKLTKYIVIASSLAFISVDALAAFDVGKGIVAATTPLLTAAAEHWGKVITLSGIGATFLGEGDGRAKAAKALVGVLAGSAFCLFCLNVVA